MQTTDSNTLQTSISIPWGELQQVIDWCDSNCTQMWRFAIITDAGEQSGNYRFEFDSDKDFVKFMLWLN